MSKKKNRKLRPSNSKADDETAQAKNDSTNQRTDSGLDESSSGNWSNNTKRIVSVVVVLHLLAVFSAPFAMPEPASGLSKSIDGVFGPYTSMLNMRHGYRFFALNPGPSHLIVFEVTPKDGSSVIKGRFPDKKNHIPRLMYHRFFMISEHFWSLGETDRNKPSAKAIDELTRAANFLRENGMNDQANWVIQSIPVDPETSLSDKAIEAQYNLLKEEGKKHKAEYVRKQMLADRENLAAARKHRDVWLAGIATYLKRKYNGAQVKIWTQEHAIPDFEHVLDGGKLDETLMPRFLVYADGEEIE